MIYMKRILGMLTVISAGVVFSSISGSGFGQKESGGDSAVRSGVEFWSSKEAALSSETGKTTGLYAMQGVEAGENVDYNHAIPLNTSGGEYGIALDRSIFALEDAMEESVEIMRSLSIKSSSMLEGAAIDGEAQLDGGMCIDDFEIQKPQFEQENISRSGYNQVIAQVDISLPKIVSGCVIDEQEMIENDKLESLRYDLPEVISSATLKVVDVLLDHGEQERALSMLEAELKAFVVN